MKKQALILALLASAGFVGSSSAAAADGNINFTGAISSTTCKIEGQTANGAIDKNVLLPTVSTSALNKVGAVAGATPFSITLGGADDSSCTNGVLAQVYFEPTSPQINAATGNLSVTAGGAEGVEIQVLDAKNKVLDLRDPSTNTEKVTIASNTAVLKYAGQYVATSDTVKAGAANSTVKYSIAYN